jgi:hypothetical protein
MTLGLGLAPFPDDDFAQRPTDTTSSSRDLGVVSPRPSQKGTTLRG